jgi:hypothetical protein
MQPPVCRRTLHEVTLQLVLGLCLVCVAAAGQATMHIQPTNIAGIQIIPYSDVAFSSTLAGMADRTDLTPVNGVLPFTMIVRNTTSQKILALTTRYEIAKPGGRKQVISTRYESLANPAFSFPPQGLLLISPFAGLGVAINSHKGLFLPEVQRSLDRWLPMLQGSTKVELSVDSVLFEDGTIAGPDVADYMGDVQETVRARKEFQAQIHRVDKSSLRSWLESQKKKDYPTHGSPRPDFYTTEWDSLAWSLIADLEARGPDEMLRRFDDMVNQYQTRLYKKDR